MTGNFLQSQKSKTKSDLDGLYSRTIHFLDSINDGVLMLDNEWRFTYLNRRAEEILRPIYPSRDVLIGRDFWEAFPDTLGTPLEENYRRAQREGVAIHFEIYYPALRLWFEIHAYPSSEGLSVHYQDITERKTAQDALLQQHEWFAVTLASIGDAVITTDVQGRVTFLNPVAETMTGWQTREALHKPIDSIFKLIHQGTRGITENPISEALRSGFVVELESDTVLVSRTGKEIAIEDSAAPIRDVHGKVIGAVMVFHDVTDRRQIALALSRSEERWRSIFTHAAVGVALVMADGRVIQTNAKFAEIVGYPEEELIGKSVLDFTHPEDKADTSLNIRQLLLGEIPNFVMEKRYYRKDGSVVWSLTTVTVVRDENGNVQHLIGIIEDISARKTAEDETLRSKERLSLALAAGGLGDWEWDLESDMVTASPRAQEIFGITSPTITWTEMRALLHEEDQERAKIAVEKALREKSYYRTEYRVNHPSGKMVWVAAYGRGKYRSDGKVLGMSGFISDVTEQKQAEEQRLRLASVVESSDDAILSMDLNAIVTTWNKGAERTFGYSADEIIGKSITLLIPPGLENEEPEILSRLKAGERIEHYETERMRKDGTRLHVSLSVSPLFNAQGKITGVSKISRDITASIKAQQALRDETRILELLNDTGTAIASQLDLQTLVQIVTDAAKKLCGAQFGAFFYNVIDSQGEAFMLYTLSGAPREAFEKFGHPRATPLFGPTFRGEGAIRIADVLKDSRYGTMPPHHGMPKGHLPVRSYLAVPVISRTGEVIGGLFFGHSETDVFTERSERLIVGIAAQAAIAIDNAKLYEAAQKELSERKRVAEELKKAQEELSHHAVYLEEQVELRTASLREAIAQLEEFSYSVSHDLRAPLRAIAGYTDVVLKDYGPELPEDAIQFLEKIARSADRMQRLINDVLSMSRIARSELTLRSIALQSFVEELVEQHLEMQSPKAIISIHTPHTVTADDASLGQIVTNLLGNAVKFVAPGVTPMVTIRSEKHGEQVRVWFEDNGIGINPEHTSKLFGMFQRLTTDPRYEGTGIGLAIVRKAIERMGGTVGVEPGLNGGSRFWIDLKEAQ